MSAGPSALALAAAALLAIMTGCAATVVGDRPMDLPAPVDLVVRNARVVTLDPMRPEAESFAVASGRFRVVGSDAQVQPYVGSETRVVDAAGAVILPGFIDAHLHLFGEGHRLQRLDLVGTRSLDEVLALVQREAKRLGDAGEPAGTWIRGRSWDQNDWPRPVFPAAADLDSVVADRPVALTRIDGHALWANSRALALAGVDRSTANPAGGRILRDGQGQPTGILIDGAMDLVLGRLPPPTRAQKLDAAVRAAAECVKAGLVGVHEPGIDGDEIDVLKELYRKGEMPLRVYAMLSPGEALDRYVASGPEVGLFEQRLTVRAVKFYADGALGSRGAALLEPYSDEAGSRGLLRVEREELEREVRRVALAGLQPCVHAIGDRANRMVLDVFEGLDPERRHAVRPRIEHAQHISPRDLDRFARLGVIASMQPTHATSDMPWVEDRLGRDRLAGSYAWKSLLGRGARLACGSDAPVESVRPLLGLYAAVTRQDAEGSPESGFQPQERLTMDEALACFTRGAAQAGFEEEVRGSIAPGKLADFVLLPADPRRVPPAQLLTMRVLATYVAGEAVYTADAAASSGR